MATTTPLRILGLSIALVSVAACTGECSFGGIDPEKVEEAIVSGVKSQRGVDVTAECGDENITEKKGETFECTVTSADGYEGLALVEMLGEGNVSWEIQGIDPEKIESFVKDTVMTESQIAVSVDCGDLPFIERPGESMECSAAFPDGTTGTVKVDMLGDGNVDWNLTPDEPSEGGAPAPDAPAETE